MKKFALLVLVIAAFLAVAAAFQVTEKRTTLLENDRVRVKEVLIEPGVKYGPHTHEYAHVGVIVKAGKLEFTENGKAEVVDFKAGQAGWREKGVTHSIRNLGSKTVHVVEVEIKK